MTYRTHPRALRKQICFSKHIYHCAASISYSYLKANTRQASTAGLPHLSPRRQVANANRVISPSPEHRARHEPRGPTHRAPVRTESRDPGAWWPQCASWSFYQLWDVANSALSTSVSLSVKLGAALPAFNTILRTQQINASAAGSLPK